MRNKTRSAISYATLFNFAGFLASLLFAQRFHKTRYLLGAALFGVATVVGAVWLSRTANKKEDSQ